MGIILDIILVAVIILTVAVSAKRGVITTVLSLVAFAAAVIIASFSAKPVAEAAYNTFLSNPIQDKIQESIPSNSALNYAEKAQIVMDNIPDFAKKYAEKAGLDISALSSQISKAGIGNNSELSKNLESEFVKPVTVLVLKSIMFFLLTIALAIILRLIAKAIGESIKHFPLVGTADAVAGAAIGILEGAVIVFVICCLLTYMKPQIKEPEISRAVSESSIVGFTESFGPMEVITSAEALFQK